jgi:hypothetical protein
MTPLARSELSAQGNASASSACGRTRHRHSLKIHRWRSVLRRKRETADRKSGAGSEASEPHHENPSSTWGCLVVARAW